MNNTKHTPGPWLQNYICAASTNEVKVNGNRIALVLQYDEKQNRVADFQTCEANAKLIAAAPELLELAELLDVDDRFINEFDNMDQLLTQVRSWAAKARLAIKKATE